MNKRIRLDGAAVKLAGYPVPHDQVKGEVKEFLQVPYFGACIHRGRAGIRVKMILKPKNHKDGRPYSPRILADVSNFLFRLAKPSGTFACSTFSSCCRSASRPMRVSVSAPSTSPSLWRNCPRSCCSC